MGGYRFLLITLTELAAFLSGFLLPLKNINVYLYLILTKI